MEGISWSLGFKTLVPQLQRLPCFVLVDISVNITLRATLPPHHVMEAMSWTFLCLLSTLILCKCQQCFLLPTTVILHQTGEGIRTGQDCEIVLSYLKCCNVSGCSSWVRLFLFHMVKNVVVSFPSESFF